MIPRRLIRTVPTETSDEIESFWDEACRLHPDWEHLTLRDPISSADCPHSVGLRHRCTSGAQYAGLVRLEALRSWGGVYVDSDFECYRSFEPLVGVHGFAGWEDRGVVPDAVLGFEPGHPALDLMWKLAVDRLPGGAWESGPGVTTAVLPGRHDVLLLPPGSFYPYHWTRRDMRNGNWRELCPWAIGAHHWAASWQR